jgi:TP901 family phage tail tape measure protein
MAVTVGVNLEPNSKKVEAALARIQAQAKGIDFGGGARSIEKLSRPLGKITGQATEFQKSLEASNARVLAFGASVAVINKLSQAFGALVENTIRVEATFAKINTILGGTQKQLEQFGNGIFAVAQKTATSFDQVAEGALELARQGLSVEESLSRVETSLKLVRVAGIDSQQAVAGLTAAIKGFEGAGLTVAQIADKLAEVDTKFAVSTEDLINGLERASASARVAGVSFDELLAVVTTVQERTQRGGAVIGNAFKTIFARLGRTDTLVALEELGISVLDTEGNVRSAIPLFTELAFKLDELGLKSIQAGDVIQKVAGVRQRDILISLVEDLTSGQSQFANALNVSAGAAGSLDRKNAQLNDTLEALINNLTVGAQKLSSVIGELGFADAAKDILKVFSSVVNGITDLLQGDSIGSKFAQGLIKGIGGILTGPGLALISAIFVKLFVDLAKFGASSLRSLLGINKAAEAQKSLQQSVLQTLLQNENIQREILALEGNKVAQEQLLLKIYNQQAAALARVQKAAATVTPGLFKGGFRGGESGVGRTGRGASGYVAAEARDVSRGVGGAPASSKVVSIPNFAFGGGKRGTMVANTSEYFVPNYAGGGDAIFNRDMVRSGGLPSGARKINAAGGFIPNFAKRNIGNFGFLVPEKGAKRPLKDFDVSLGGKKTTLTGGTVRGIDPSQAKTVSDPIEGRIKKSVIDSSTAYANELQPLGRSVSRTDIENGFGTIAGAKGALQSAIGAAFEVGITKSLDYKAAQREKGGDFDIRGGVNLPRIQKLFGMPSSMSIADLKVSDSVGNTESFYSKVMKEIGAGPFGAREKKANARKLAAAQLRKKYPGFYTTKGLLKTRGISSSDKKRMQDLEERTTNKIFTSRFGNASSGYIPNFAMSPLDDAIEREKAAGLPINQIRINQSGKLRSAQNPMGLAVTNTRDEPTGAIPNFAKPLNASKSGSGGEGMGGSGGGLFALFALQAALGGLTNTVDDSNKSAKNFGDGLSSFVNTLIVLQATGLGPQGLGSLKGVGKFTNVLKKSFGGLKRFLGPVALGLGALDGVLKAGGAGGIVETFKTLKDSATGDGRRKAVADIESSQIRALEQGKFSGSTDEGVTVARGQVAKFEQGVRDAKIGVRVNPEGSSLFDLDRKSAIKDLARQEKLLERAREQLSKTTTDLAQKEATQAEFRSGARITKEQADTRTKEFFARRGGDIEVTKGSANLEGQKKLLTETSLIEKDRIQSQIQSNDLIAEMALARNDNLQTLAQELIESEKVGGIEKEKLESVLDSINFKTDEVAMSEQLAKSLGVEQSVARGILENARAKNAVLESEHTTKTTLLKQTQALAALEAQIAESRRLASRNLSNDLGQARSGRELGTIKRDAGIRGNNFELKSGAIGSGREREIKFLNEQMRLEEELTQLKGRASDSETTFLSLKAQADAGNLSMQDEKYQNAVNQLIIDQERLDKLTPLIEAEKQLAQFRGQQSGFSLGLEELDSTILSFEDKLGREIPGLFADNLGTAIKDAVTGAEDIGDALSKAGESFLGYIRDAFLQQAANQATSAIFGGMGGGGAPGTGGGLVSTVTGVAGVAGAAGAAGAEGEKKGGIGGFFSNLFGGGKKGGGALGGSPTNPLFVQDVANAIGGGAATGAEKALENITGKEGTEQEGFFSKIKSGFGDLLGGLKDKLGGMFSGLKDSLGGLFGGGAGGGGIFSSLLGGLGGIGSGIGGIFSSLLGGFSGGLGSLFSFFNTGGPVGRGTDTVPAMLTPGEFVVKKSAVDKYGTGFLSSLNNGVLPMRGFQNGGSVSPVAAEAGASAMGGNQISNNSDFTFNIQDSKVSQEGGQGSSENQREFASRIRSAVTTVIQEESRSGGSLNYLYKS